MFRRQPLYPDPNKCSPHTIPICFVTSSSKLSPSLLYMLLDLRTNYETVRHFLHTCYYLPLRSKQFSQQSALTHLQPVRRVLSRQSRHAIQGRNPVWIKNRWLSTKTNCKGYIHLLTVATNIYIITVLTALYIYIYIYIYIHTHTHMWLKSYIYIYI